MAGSGASRGLTWKGKLRRLVAAPFRFLLKDELARVTQAEEALAALGHALAEVQQSSRQLGRVLEDECETREREVSDLRQGYLATRAEFEEVRDRRLPRLEADFSGFQEGFSLLQREVEELRDGRVPAVERAAGSLQAAFDELQGELLRVRDQLLPQLEESAMALQAGHDRLQHEVENLRDRRLPELGASLEALHKGLGAVQALAEELRDERLPAASARLDALMERLFEELTVTRSLVDRILHDSPLVVPQLEPAVEDELPEAVRRASRRFLDAHRGSRAEILERCRDYVEIFRGGGPVLDVGCGRGELLEALTTAGIPAFGVDTDAAAVAACRELGLAARVGDGVEALAAQPEASLGGVACIHVIEHLSAARWMKLVELAAKALRPGGILAVESPNPETLRVGASLFWLDPTHLRPVHPEAVRFVAEAVGLEVIGVRRLRPFPAEEQLARKVPDARWEPAMGQLDQWLSGFRDYVVVARKPVGSEAAT
ncbi:MAG: methyltransferase domain-containing protein [Thermoanaerobaculum sp.]